MRSAFFVKQASFFKGITQFVPALIPGLVPHLHRLDVPFRLECAVVDVLDSSTFGNTIIVTFLTDTI